jgi:hypothetical protein
VVETRLEAERRARREDAAAHAAQVSELEDEIRRLKGGR